MSAPLTLDLAALAGRLTQLQPALARLGERLAGGPVDSPWTAEDAGDVGALLTAIGDFERVAIAAPAPAPATSCGACGVDLSAAVCLAVRVGLCPSGKPLAAGA